MPLLPGQVRLTDIKELLLFLCSYSFKLPPTCFHIQIEKDVLHYLLKGTQPIILALARGLKQKVETKFQQPIQQGRLLIVTPFAKEIKRVTEQTAQTRNKMMIKIADSITVGYTSAGGSLEMLLRSISHSTLVNSITC